MRERQILRQLLHFGSTNLHEKYTRSHFLNIFEKTKQNFYSTHEREERFDVNCLLTCPPSQVQYEVKLVFFIRVLYAGLDLSLNIIATFADLTEKILDIVLYLPTDEASNIAPVFCFFFR